jgi:K+-transporting ATPase KdpF subunit
MRRSDMMFDYTLGGLVTVGILVYLTFALLRPERF